MLYYSMPQILNLFFDKNFPEMVRAIDRFGVDKFLEEISLYPIKDKTKLSVLKKYIWHKHAQ
jgi:hypothetical protein